jgi:hypothetical protein
MRKKMHKKEQTYRFQTVNHNGGNDENECQVQSSHYFGKYDVESKNGYYHYFIG